jgi:hypothetical protein
MTKNMLIPRPKSEAERSNLSFVRSVKPRDQENGDGDEDLYAVNFK